MCNSDPDTYPGAVSVLHDCDPTNDAEPGLDEDNDGFETPMDCDDSDHLVHPGMGLLEEDPTLCMRDADGDGYGAFYDPDDSSMVYQWGTDCDDTDPAINPSAVEIADNLDNDCNGLADDVQSSQDMDGDGATAALYRARRARRAHRWRARWRACRA